MHDGDFQSPHFVFVEFNNGTGWSSSAIAFIVGLINPNWSFSCLDAATHIAEESLSPATDIPKAILGTVAIGFITSFTYSIAMFSIKNLMRFYHPTPGNLFWIFIIRPPILKLQLWFGISYSFDFPWLFDWLQYLGIENYL